MRHIFFDPEKMRLHLLDQRALPENEKYVECASLEDAIAAIKNMTVRGAPAIGVTAAYACLLALSQEKADGNWRQNLEKRLDALMNARPTAVNLRWAVERMLADLRSSQTPEELLSIWLRKAFEIHSEDENICRRIGELGQTLIKDGMTVLTHCNAGALATGGYGTALGVFRAAWEKGKKFSVLADETRPLLQGSRLTAWELQKEGIPVSVICDNSAALMFERGDVDLVVTGADRIAANGDTANKIGTLGVAIIAHYYNTPFYIAAPVSTIDFRIQTGAEIPLEERQRKEVSQMGGQMLVPEGVNVINFAFDVTPARLISGIITEKGILKPPFERSIAALAPAGEV